MSLDEEYFRDLFIARAFVISGYTILVYETIAILPEEVRFIWPTRWSTIKIIYLIVRYGNLIFLTLGVLQNMGKWWSDARLFCYQSTLAITLIQLASFSLLHVLLLLRAWATWGRHIRILIILVALFVLYAAATCAIGAWAVVSAGPDDYPFSEVTKTCLTPVSRECYLHLPLVDLRGADAVTHACQWIVWLPSLLLECAVFILTMFSLRKYHFDYSVERHNPIVRVIARDGIIYFSVSVFNGLFNIFVWAFLGAGPLNMLASTFTLCVLISANIRLVLDLRQVSTSDDLSTTRVAREVSRAIRARPLTNTRHHSRGPSPLTDESAEWPTTSDSAGWHSTSDDACDPGPSNPCRADVEGGVLGGKGKQRMESDVLELRTFNTFSEGTATTRGDEY
ncbi:hypothetical protein C8Q80DRAFT_1294255 [Daedaleopsis nitida]|nr:hypothetical protein C8Q80DRAFT_1294255 [Daedaleopsis nitida]